MPKENNQTNSSSGSNNGTSNQQRNRTRNGASHSGGYQRSRKRRGGKPKNASAQTPVKVSFLGGLNEIGKNMTLYD